MRENWNTMVKRHRFWKENSMKDNPQWNPGYDYCEEILWADSELTRLRHEVNTLKVELSALSSVNGYLHELLDSLQILIKDMENKLA